MGDTKQTCKITPLGAGNEVGRSCILLEFKGKTIMLDCGIHPAYNGLAGLPYFDMVDPATIDMVLITHFHLDHVGALPYFLEKTTFKGKVFMTHPTKAIYKWLLLDFVKVSSANPEDSLYHEQDLIHSYDKIQAVDYHQEIECSGVKFTCYNAGHVLGAAMFLIDIADVKILYTGDYSREEDRHLLPAEVPVGLRPDILICESTYGVQSHEPREERERRFVKMVHEVVGRGGKCLLPVFALGKAQELLLILDEYWEVHPELQSIPIFYASSLAKKCLAIYQTYLNMMNPRLRDSGYKRNPFVFKYVSNLKDQGDLLSDLDSGPCVMMASPGMLQSGLSRKLFEHWCADKRNGVVLPGYSVEGTLAKTILTEPSEISPLSGGQKLPLRMSVDAVSFSAHVDFIQNSSFIDSLRPHHLVLVHGESNEMNRLKLAIQHKYSRDDDEDLGAADSESSTTSIKIFTPKNCETVSIDFLDNRILKVLGSLASSIQEAPNEAETGGGLPIDAVVIGKNFEYQLVAKSELESFSSLKTFSLRQRLLLNLCCPWNLVVHAIHKNFGSSNLTGIEDFSAINITSSSLTVMEMIFVTYVNSSNQIMVEWDSSPSADLFADAVLALITSAASSPSSVKLSSKSRPHCHGHSKGSEFSCDADREIFAALLRESFYDIITLPPEANSIIKIMHHGAEYVIDFDTMVIEGHDAKVIAHLSELLTLFTLGRSDGVILPCT